MRTLILGFPLSDGTGVGGHGIRHLSRVPVLAGTIARRSLRAVLRIGGWRRTLGPRYDVAGRIALRSGTFGAVGAALRCQRDRGAHAADEDRTCRAGAPAVPSIAAGRGGGDRRSDQQRAADPRRRSQWCGAHLRGLWRALWREPRTLRRGPRHRAQGVDAGEGVLSGQVSSLRGCGGGAEAVSAADTADPRRPP